jgi:hypothetical protein
MKTYKIVSAMSPTNLEAEVNFLLNQGWQYVGGLTVVGSSYGNIIYYQSMSISNTNE